MPDAYTLTITEQDKRLSHEPIGDPFIHTTIHVCGWRNAWAVLRRRYSVIVHVNGDRERVNAVMALNNGSADRPVYEVERDRFGTMYSGPLEVGECIRVSPVEHSTEGEAG